MDRRCFCLRRVCNILDWDWVLDSSQCSCKDMWMGADVTGVRAGTTTVCRTPRWSLPTAVKDCVVSAAICSGGLDNADARSHPCSADLAVRRCPAGARHPGRNDGTTMRVTFSFVSWRHLLFRILYHFWNWHVRYRLDLEKNWSFLYAV